MEVSLKRTQRIEIIRYIRRVSPPRCDASDTAGAEDESAFPAFSMTVGDRLFDPDRPDDANGQAVRVEPRTAQRRHPWFWLEWLKRE